MVYTKAKPYICMVIYHGKTLFFMFSTLEKPYIVIRNLVMMAVRLKFSQSTL